MNFIQWTDLAFNELESLPEKIAFEIVKQVDLLGEFPEIGAPMESRFPRLKEMQQLIIIRNYRVIYEFEADEKTIYVLTVQNCRQKLLSLRDLKRRKKETE